MSGEGGRTGLFKSVDETSLAEAWDGERSSTISSHYTQSEGATVPLCTELAITGQQILQKITEG